MMFLVEALLARPLHSRAGGTVRDHLVQPLLVGRILDRADAVHAKAPDSSPLQQHQRVPVGQLLHDKLGRHLDRLVVHAHGSRIGIDDVRRIGERFFRDRFRSGQRRGHLWLTLQFDLGQDQLVHFQPSHCRGHC